MTKTSAQKCFIKKLFFDATNVIKGSNEEKYVHNACGIEFDGKTSWSFDDDTVRNVVIFDVDNSS